MKRKIPGLLLSLLLLLTLTACDEFQGTHSASITGYYGTSDQLVDLPVAEPEDGNQGNGDQENGNVPDDNQDAGNDWTSNNSRQVPGNENPDVNTDEGNRPGGKSDEGNASVDEDGWYTSKEEVALYIHLYGELPDNYVTKDEAEEAGWSGGNVERYTGEGTAIGGSRFGNREGLLPKEQGRTYTECDIDTPGNSSRGAKRIVFSNDGLIYYTDDHYESFELLYGEP